MCVAESSSVSVPAAATRTAGPKPNARRYQRVERRAGQKNASATATPARIAVGAAATLLVVATLAATQALVAAWLDAVLLPSPPSAPPPPPPSLPPFPPFPPPPPPPSPSPPPPPPLPPPPSPPPPPPPPSPPPRRIFGAVATMLNDRFRGARATNNLTTAGVIVRGLDSSSDPDRPWMACTTNWCARHGDHFSTSLVYPGHAASYGPIGFVIDPTLVELNCAQHPRCGVVAALACIRNR